MPQQIDFDPKVDYYKALGVGAESTADEIKKAYRKLAKQFHPDSTGGDKAKEGRFKDVSNAYDVLGDAKKRQLYDQIRANGGAMPGMGMGGNGGYTTYGPGPGVFDLGDLFGQFFSSQQGAGAARGGVRFRGEPEPRGRAKTAQDAEYEETIKASDGSWLRVEGVDVHSDVRISFERAILGTVASVATIDGKADVKIPPGTSSGRKLRLRGKGTTDRAGHAGDHYITVQIDVPAITDDEGKKRLHELVTHAAGEAKKSSKKH